MIDVVDDCDANGAVQNAWEWIWLRTTSPAMPTAAGDLAQQQDT